MKKIICAILGLLCLPILNAQADQCTPKFMINEIKAINLSLAPVVDATQLTTMTNDRIREKIMVLRLYDMAKPDADPQKATTQAMFFSRNGQCKLLALIFDGNLAVSDRLFGVPLFQPIEVTR